MDWKGRRVLVTGGGGFLGRVLVKRLQELGADVRSPARVEMNCLSIISTEGAVWRHEPEVVFHLAAKVGGIAANIREPASFFFENVQMALNMFQACVRLDKRPVIVTVGSTCMYPKDCPQPMIEEDVFNGEPEPTNAAYAHAKRAILAMGQAYAKQHELDVRHVILANLYGPGDDFFSDDSHVIPALVRRFSEAGAWDKVTVWGTGRARRQFIHVDEAVHGLILAAEAAVTGPLVVNIANGPAMTIEHVVNLIRVAANHKGAVDYDTTKPDGQASRELAGGRAKRMGYHYQVPFTLMLSQLVDEFRKEAARC